ncbi:MAG: hypothetical protein LBL86_08340 [Coriobacteriales bacterium]|nr:hypothetical protein [Coriobacteriales bacterium]
MQQIRQCHQDGMATLPTMHEELMRLYRAYICIGGMPEAVQRHVGSGNAVQEFDSSFFDALCLR